jgi:hypothetical protein
MDSSKLYIVMAVASLVVGTAEASPATGEGSGHAQRIAAAASLVGVTADEDEMNRIFVERIMNHDNVDNTNIHCHHNNNSDGPACMMSPLDRTGFAI